MPEFEVFDTPLRIGVIADTHRSSRNPRALPMPMLRSLEGCDLILHAGDVNAPWVLRELEKLAPVRAVRGNNEEIPLATDLPEELFLQVGNIKFGLMHGNNPRLSARGYVFERMRGLVDLAVYGHSHEPEFAERDGLQMLNPGSPTQRRFQPNPTFAIVCVGDSVQANILTLDP